MFVTCFYVSGHGWGHATRANKIITELLKLKYKVYIVSNAARFIFEQVIELGAIYRQAAIDGGVVQPLAYTVDRQKTIENLDNFISKRAAISSTEIEWLKSIQANCVLCDAPFLPCAAAKAISIPSVIVSNFTFDQVYLGLLSKENDALDQKLLELIDIVIADYRCANLLLRLPGAIRIPSFDDSPQLVPGENQVCIINGRSQIPFIESAPIQTPDSIVERRIIDVPLVYRKAIRTRQQVLNDLGIPGTHKILLLSFGGHLYDTSRWDVNAILPKDWICIVSGMTGDSIELPNGFYRASRDEYVPDLTNASDVVLGKLGYGTCSECVGHQKPFIYVPRTQFIEEYGLLKFMKDQGSVVKLEQADFEDGRWKTAILKADSLSGTCDNPNKKISYDGGVVSAKIIDNYLNEWVEAKKNYKQ
ncbi:hypothetical protein K501DRAFT_332676 [Backusella circina FSU 941]|nr:hypothetical protein K501DRAFT_332676 [Backusella circina FSU 941]